MPAPVLTDVAPSVWVSCCRFGESNLHSCEVMLKDMTDSKRLNTTIRQLTPTSSTHVHPDTVSTLSHLHAHIVSYLFWPELQEQQCKLPDDVAQALEVGWGSGEVCCCL